jgi:plastocyanin
MARSPSTIPSAPDRRVAGPLATFVASIVVGVLAVVTVPAVRLIDGGGVSADAGSGVIRGHVEGRRVVRAERRPTPGDLETPLERERTVLTRAVVYLQTAPRGAFEQNEPGRAVLDQRDETFVPHVLAITTGTTVDFPNSDRIYHNVFSLSKAARFDLGRYPVGHSKAIRFDKPGIVRVFCDIHSHMNAFILVFSHPYFALTDAEGRYRIDKIPPGVYNVIAWNEGVASEPRSATVPDGGATELDFSLR